MCLFILITACEQGIVRPLSAVDDVEIHSGTATSIISTSKTPELLSTNLPKPSAGVATGDNTELDLISLPIIPEFISKRTIEIYKTGQKLNNHPHAFSVIGDCESTSSWFLGDFDKGIENYSLGKYSNLSEVIDAFKGSFGRNSMAVHRGFNTASVLSPLWADPVNCQAGESPLTCEIRIQQPSIVFILLGSNDEFILDKFEKNLRDILDALIKQGIVPILATKADNVEGKNIINTTIVKLALEYEIPLWNFWRAVQDIPDHGLQADGTHLTWGHNYFDDPKAMEKAWPWRNLTALQVLDKVWRNVLVEIK